MATLTIKNIPDDLYEKLKASAKNNRRSLNNEVIMMMELFLRRPKIKPEIIQARAAKLRELTAHYVITEAELEEWIHEGRS